MMLFLMRNLLVILLAIFTSTAWSQQPGTIQPAAWPQILFWTLNPYNLQPQLWAQPATMPRVAAQPGVPPVLPFPTPFWLWPLPPQQSPIALPSPAAPLPTTPSPPPVPAAQVETPTPETPPVTLPEVPEVPEATLTKAPTTTPATPEISLTKQEQAPVEALHPIAPIETTVPAPAIEAQISPITPTENMPQAAAEAKPAREAIAPKKAKTAKKKSTKKVRKLCWKDGRLDVCP